MDTGKSSRALSVVKTRGFTIQKYKKQHVYIPIANRKNKNKYKKKHVLGNFLRRVNLDAFWTRNPSTVYKSYICFRQSMLSWKNWV